MINATTITTAWELKEHIQDNWKKLIKRLKFNPSIDFLSWYVAMQYSPMPNRETVKAIILECIEERTISASYDEESENIRILP